MSDKLKKTLSSLLYALVFMLVVLFQGHSNENIFANELIWKEAGVIPQYSGDGAQSGLASPFAGYHNGALIIAGGCNFPDKPVSEGGKKRYYDHIYILDEKGNISISDTKFPFPVAYGASVSTDYGMVCLGGSNSAEDLNQVILMSWDPAEKGIDIEEWPKLPYRMTNSAAALVDNIIYIAGGTSDGQLANKFLSLDLTKRGTGKFHWKELEDFPGPARIQPIAISQNAAEEAHFYLFSGSSYPEDAENPIVTTDGLQYNPRTRLWEQLPMIQPAGGNLYSLHGGSGIPVGTHHIIFAGGVNKKIFADAWRRERAFSNAIESGDTLASNKLSRDIYNYFQRDPEWYHFNKEILAYHTITQTWAVIDTYPFPASAGAPVVKAHNGWYVVSGEIKPGVRSPKISGVWKTRITPI